MDIVAGTIWLAFAIDYLVRLQLSGDCRAFFRTHLLDLIMVALPMLRLIRDGLVLRTHSGPSPSTRWPDP